MAQAPEIGSVPPRSQESEYAALKSLVKAHGLFAPQPVYYSKKIAVTLGLLATSIAALLAVHVFWLQLLNAVYLGFIFTQIATLGHDIGHRQVFRTRGGILLGTLAVDVLVGVSLSWWIERHNRHHSHPNQVDLDPDIDIPLFALSGFDLARRQGLARFIVRWQAYVFFPAQAFAALVFRIWSVQFLRRDAARHPWLEGAALLTHVALYCGLLLSSVTLWQAILFAAVNQAAFGLYMGSIFAPNHKGMLTLEKDSTLDFLRQQVLTARNVRAHPITDFWYAGSNYQIEHHLFPNLPRNQLRRTQQIVKDFCAVRAIAYYETGVLQSYREILQSLREIGATQLL